MASARSVAIALSSALVLTLGGVTDHTLLEPPVVAADRERPRVALLGDTPAPSGSERPSPQATRERDIIVFMVDDLVYLPDQRVLERLPNIERIFIDGGMRFTNMNSTVALCGPSRVTFLTGRYPLHHGVVRNEDTFRTPRRTVNYRLMDRVGYTTLNQGKGIHVEVKGGQDIGWSRRDQFARKSARYQEQGARWIEEAPRDRPLFAWYSTNYPHEIPRNYYPYVEPEARDDPRCADLPRFRPPTYRTWSTPRAMPFHMPMDVEEGWDLTTTCESLLGIDEAIGSVVAAQQERERPVLLVFMTDHGVAHGQFGYPFKWNPYARRTEFYVAGTGVPAGVTTDTLVSDIDVAPTLAEAAEVKLGYRIDGRSFWPLVQGDMEHLGRQHHLCHFEDPDPSIAFRCVVTPDRLAIFWDDGREKLTRAGRWGRRNLKDTEPGRLERLRQKADVMYDESRS